MLFISPVLFVDLEQTLRMVDSSGSKEFSIQDFETNLFSEGAMPEVSLTCLEHAGLGKQTVPVL